MEEIETKVRGDLEKRFEEQEKKIAKNLELSRKSEVLFNNAEAMIAKQKNETANMLGTVYSNIIEVVRADEAHIQELEGKILTNLEEKIDKQKNETGSHMTRISWLCLFC